MGASGWEERWMKWCTHHSWCLPHKSAGALLWSGIASVDQISATICVQKTRPADDQGFSISAFFLPWWHAHIPRWASATDHQDQLVEECLREHETLFPHMDWPPQSSELKPIVNLFHALEKTLRCSPTLPSSIQERCEKWMQLWTEVNAVTSISLSEQCTKSVPNLRSGTIPVVLTTFRMIVVITPLHKRSYFKETDWRAFVFVQKSKDDSVVRKCENKVPRVAVWTFIRAQCDMNLRTNTHR